jgi:hypothetical protein
MADTFEKSIQNDAIWNEVSKALPGLEEESMIVSKVFKDICDVDIDYKLFH